MMSNLHQDTNGFSFVCRAICALALTVMPAPAVWAQSGINPNPPPALRPYARQPTEAEIRLEYDRRYALAKLVREYHVRHILLPTRTEAEVALRRIQSGKLFADVASTSSVDAGTRVLGGDLGWHELTRFPEAFANTVVSLAPAGLATEPTQTIAGWHVIELLETQMGKESFPKLPALRGRIITFLQDARTSSVSRVIAQAVCRKRVDPQVPASVVQSAGNARVGVEMRVEDGRVTEIISMTGPSEFHAAVKEAVGNYGCDKLDRPVIATQTFQF